MKILRTAAEYQRLQKTLEKLKKQSSECPGCYTTAINSYTLDVKGIESIWTGNNYYCECHKCGTIWETDDLK